VLGYCVFPILLAAAIITIIKIAFKIPFVASFIICGLAAFWSISCKV